MTHDPETVERVARAIECTMKDPFAHREEIAEAALSAMPPVTVGEAAKVLLDMYENPDSNPMPIPPQRLYDAMTNDHNESLEISGRNDWPSLLCTAFRALATPDKESDDA